MAESLPTKTFTVGLPGVENSWVKRKFMQVAEKKEKARNLHDDLTWEVCGCPDDLEAADA